MTFIIYIYIYPCNKKNDIILLHDNDNDDDISLIENI
jgi:hypothetical protein